MSKYKKRLLELAESLRGVMLEKANRLHNEFTWETKETVDELVMLINKLSLTESPNKFWTKDYRGFESIMDFDEEWIEDAMPKITPNGEYQGTIRITFEYIPSEEEEND